MLFWIFGYRGVVGPLVMALKVRKVLRALEQAHSKGDLRRALQSEETRQVAIDLIASEHRIPRFLATRVWQRLAQASGFSVSPGPSPGRS